MAIIPCKVDSKKKIFDKVFLGVYFGGDFLCLSLSHVYMVNDYKGFARQMGKGPLLLLKWNDQIKKVGVFFLFTVIWKKRKV